MSTTTTTAPTETAEAFAPERRLSHLSIRGIRIGLNIVCRVALCRPLDQARSMIWLVNYARHRECTADALAAELDLSHAEIRAALTDPEADLRRFLPAVARVRAAFEATLPGLVTTAPCATVREAFAHAREAGVIAEVVGPTRMGKTVPARDLYLRHLDQAVWLDCPSDGSEHTFFGALADALGFSHLKKTSQLRPQVKSVFATGLLRLLVVDEAHGLWPRRTDQKPVRLEFIRELFDARHGRANPLGVLLLATPQYTAALLAAMEDNARWAPGQYDGRRVPYHLAETMSRDDLLALARHHAPEFTARQHDDLVEQAEASAGFAGAMVLTIGLARRKARAADPAHPVVTDALLLDAQAQMARGTRLETLAKAVKPARKPAPVPGTANGHGRAVAATLTIGGVTANGARF